MPNNLSRIGTMNLRARGAPDLSGSVRPVGQFGRMNPAFRCTGSWVRLGLTL
jgi:hypothetical protein